MSIKKSSEPVPLFFRVSKKCYIYNVTSDNWDDLASMSVERYFYGVVQLSEVSFWISGEIHYCHRIYYVW